MANFPGGPKPLKPSESKPANTNMTAPAVPVVQPNPFGSSQTSDTYKPKFSPASGKSFKK